ncbi:MAG: hypothetical protein GY861_02690 [bacterium]|nr:hypothetical protein [bacterium]
MKCYRCGWCGSVTDHRGVPYQHLWQIAIIDAVSNLEEAKQVHGECCRWEVEASRGQVVTREMAMDAGDLSLEGWCF